MVSVLLDYDNQVQIAGLRSKWERAFLYFIVLIWISLNLSVLVSKTSFKSCSFDPLKIFEFYSSEYMFLNGTIIECLFTVLIFSECLENARFLIFIG